MTEENNLKFGASLDGAWCSPLLVELLVDLVVLFFVLWH